MTLRTDLVALAEAYKPKGAVDPFFALVNILIRAQEAGELIGGLVVNDSANQRVQITGASLYPATDAKAGQTVCAISAGNGVPNNANGANGDFYFRGDGTVAADTVIYHKQGGSWVALPLV